MCMILQHIQYLSCPYPATVHWNPERSWVRCGGRHTMRADADFTTQPPSLLLIFSSAGIQRQTQIWMLGTKHPAALCPILKHTPISLLKLSTSKCSWIISSSTVKLCSTSLCVSLMAFFPRNTESWWMSVLLLKKIHKRVNLSHTQWCSGGNQTVSFFSHPSSKQCAAVTTQHGEMREAPQRKFWLKIAATHGCDSIRVKKPFTILCIRCSGLSPHVISAGTQRMS